MFKGGVVFILLLLMWLPGRCQVEVTGRFYADSLKIGEPVPYSLTARYPKSFNLVFPDSTYQFAPFEFERKEFFPTRSDAETSFDSVVYYVSSYEIDSVQQLQLPVFVIHTSDCTTVMAEADQIYLKHLVESVPDSLAAPQLPLKTQTSYLNVKWLFNYPVLLIVGAVLMVLAVLTWIFFGKRIRKYFRIRTLQRHHQQFLHQYALAVDQLKTSYATLKAEQALVLWKQYMENLEGKPFTKFTSREITQHEKDEVLAQSLRQIDRMIYGGAGENVDTFTSLQNFSENRFHQKLEAIRYE